jgi:hypothetical protein
VSTPAASPAPEQIGGISVAWLALLASIFEHEGRAFRAGASGPWIEVQNMHTGEWMPITLEGRKGGDCAFATLAEIERRLKHP